MTDKSMVNVTVEYNGHVDVIEHEAAFIVAFDNKSEDEILHSVIVVGEGTIGDMGIAIGDALCSQEGGNNDGLRSAVISRLFLRSLTDHIEDEEE